MVRYALSILSESYLIVMTGALLIGLFFPFARGLSAWSTLLLQIIFFLFSLKVNWRSLKDGARTWPQVFLGTFYMLLLLPAVVWLIARWLPVDFGLALFLLAAMPAGMTTPLLVDVMMGSSARQKGISHSFALMITVLTSLLAPFTIPFLLHFFYGATVSIDAVSLFWKLVIVIFIPFIAGMLVRWIALRPVERLNPYTKPVSILLLGFLIAGSVANQADSVRNLFLHPFTLIWMFGGLIVFYLFLHLAGYFVFWWRPKTERVAASVALTYLNFVLAIYLAVQFFPQAGVLVPLVLSIIPWALALPLWKWTVRRVL